MPRQPALREALRVKPGSRVQLAKLDPNATFGHDKASSVARTARQMTRLRDLQDRIWAEQKHPVLIVLQGIDAAGKDGTIAKVMDAFDPQGCPVTSFKVPSAVELAHDYLWRVHQRTPAKGEIAIFNRSHYEDVLVVRVHDLVPRTVWSKRYDQINDFERTLAESGTTIVKFFLNIDRDEQRQRIQDRYDDPAKRWKFKLGRPRGAEALGQLPGRVQRRADQDLDRLGAVVRHPRQPQLVPQPGRLDDPGRRPGRPQAGLPGAGGSAGESRHRVRRAAQMGP